MCFRAIADVFQRQRGDLIRMALITPITNAIKKKLQKEIFC